MVDVRVVAAVVVAIVVPFVVVPEVAERLGSPAKSARTRGLVWLSFLLLLFVPAIILAPELLFRASAVDWFLFVAAIAVAVVYDYFRLNPDKNPLVQR